MLSESHQEDLRLATLVKDQRCEHAFNQLHEKYRTQVQRHCYKRLFTHEDAEDATQVAFSAFWERIDQWNGGSVTAWLFSIAKHAALKIRIHNSRKKRSGEMVYLDDSEPLSQLAEPSAEYSAIIENEVELEFDKVLLEMKPKWRLVWILHHREHYTLEEVAGIMGLASRQTAHYFLNMSVGYLRKRLWVFYDDLAGDGDPNRIDQRAAFRNLFTN